MKYIPEGSPKLSKAMTYTMLSSLEPGSTHPLEGPTSGGQGACIPTNPPEV